MFARAISHSLYRFLDGQKNTRFWFSVPGLRGIHRNLKQSKNFNSRKGFFRKSPFCTFSCINPGFCGPWTGKIEKLPKWHFWTHAWNLKFFWPKAFFWSIMKMAIRKNIHNLSQGPPNQRFMQENVQKDDFLKKPLRELKNYFCFRFLWIPETPGRVNWKRLVFFTI